MKKVPCIAKYNYSVARKNVYEPNACNYLNNCATKHTAMLSIEYISCL